MSAAKTQQPKRSLTQLYVFLALVSIVVGLVFDKPGFALAWFLLVIAAFSHPAPAPAKRVEAESPGVIARELQHRLHRKLGEGLFGAGLFPGVKLRCGWFFALGFGAVIYHLPITDLLISFEDQTIAEVPVAGWGEIANAAAALLIVTAFGYAMRTLATKKYISSADQVGAITPIPTASVVEAVKLSRSSPARIIGPAVVGATLGLVASPWLTEHTDWPAPAVTVAAAFLGVLAATAPFVRAEVVKHWHRLTSARMRWNEGFDQIRMAPAPHLVDIEYLGSEGQRIIVHHFRSSPGLGGFDKIANQAEKILSTLGGSAQAALAPVEQKDSQGQPTPGSIDNLAFDVIELPAADQMPTLSDPNLGEDVVNEVIRAVFAQVSTAEKKRVMPMGHHPVHAEASEVAAYAVEYSPYDHSALSAAIRPVAETYGAEAIVDHRSQPARVVIGGLSSANYDEASGVTVEHLERIQREGWWNKKWSDAFRKPDQNPRPEWATEDSAELSDGTTIRSLAFVLKNGFTPEDHFFPVEKKMHSALDGIDFFSMTGFQQAGKRPGDRHDVAITTRWAEAPVPSSPSEIIPVRRSSAPQWALAATVNEMFTAAKLARPELAKATPLSRGDSAALWHLHLRLYGGVTLKQVRDKARTMREAVSTEYLRVAESESGVELVIGADPERVKLAPHAATTLDGLAWEQAFIDAKMEGLGGTMPKLLDSTRGEHNTAITILTFDLRGTGMNLESFTSRRQKLMATAAKAFILPVPVADDPTRIQLIVADEDPFPRSVEPDYDQAASQRGDVVFGEDIYSTPVTFDPAETPHMLFAGMSNSGKSSTLMQLMTGFLLQGAEVYTADPSKFGADFEFARDYMPVLTGDLYETAGMLRYLYAEVTERKKLNAEHKVGNVFELPDEVRPRRIVVFIDEFTSLINPEKVPAKPPTNPEAAKAHELKVAANDARATIGDLIGRLGREARSAGLTLVLATQKLTADMLDSIGGATDLKTNMGRALQGKATYAEKAAALRNPQGAPDLGEEVPIGRGIYEPVVGSPVAYQAWFDPGGQPALEQQLSQRLAPVEKADLEGYVHRPHDGPAVEKITEASEAEVAVEVGETDLSDMDWDDDE